MLLRFLSRWNICAIALASLVCLGCGGSKHPPTYPVTGTVTYKSQPVAGAQVMFISTAGPAAEGTTGADGKFSLTTFKPGDGAIGGEHKITIVKMETAASTDPNNPYGTAKSVLPPRYGNPAQTPLKENVGTSKNEFKFELTDG